MLHVRSHNLTHLTSPLTLSPIVRFLHSNSHSCSNSNVPISPHNRGYRSLAQKSRHYGPVPSDVLPEVVNPSQIIRYDIEGEGAIMRDKQEKDATRPKLVKGTPEYLKWCSEMLSARLLGQNQQAFRELIMTGHKRTLDSYISGNSTRYRLSFLAHKIYFPTVTYKPPSLRTKKSPSYNVFVLLSLNPDNNPHPFSCRTLHASRKLRRLKDSDPEFDPRMNQIGIKVYFEKPVVENHLEGIWIPVSDLLLGKILKIYDSFGKEDSEMGDEIREVCARSFEKFVVRGESVPVVWSFKK